MCDSLTVGREGVKFGQEKGDIFFEWPVMLKFLTFPLNTGAIDLASEGNF